MLQNTSSYAVITGASKGLGKVYAFELARRGCPLLLVAKKNEGLQEFSESITKKYNASVTPEVVLVDDSDNILYQGRINNSYAAPGRMRHGKVREDLEIAIQLLLQGKEISKPWPDPIGCYITKI